MEDSVRRETARGQTLASLLSASTDQMRRLQREIKSLSAQAINNKDSTDEVRPPISPFICVRMLHSGENIWAGFITSLTCRLTGQNPTS